jgi:predicted RNA-binding Zn-ribbon protein involved in translation (DUF1610 family)
MATESSDPEQYSLDEALSKFDAYAEYVGADSINEWKSRSLNSFAFHTCSDCDIEIPVHASDPQAYGPVLCPECGEMTDYTPMREITE